MGADLISAVVLLCVVAGALFLGGRRIASHLSVQGQGALAALVVALLVWLAGAGQDRLFWARLLPVEGVVLAGGSLLPLVALLAGVLMPRLIGTSGSHRATVIVALLLALAAGQSIRPLLGSVPELDSPRWDSKGVCLQTMEASCSAASTTTLLHWQGITASEAEMAQLCLTRAEGTPMLGVYRGLRAKTAGTHLRVRVLTGQKLADLKEAVQQRHTPVLLSVGIDRWQRNIDPRYTREWGWVPGRRHAVVLRRFLGDGRIEVADPAIGLEIWRKESLAVLWHGEGILLEPTGAVQNPD